MTTVVESPFTMVGSKSAVSNTSEWQGLINQMKHSVINNKGSRTSLLLNFILIRGSKVVKSKWFWSFIYEGNQLINIIPLNDRQNRSKNFFLHDSRIYVRVHNYSWGYILIINTTFSS